MGYRAKTECEYRRGKGGRLYQNSKELKNVTGIPFVPSQCRITLMTYLSIDPLVYLVLDREDNLLDNHWGNSYLFPESLLQHLYR